MGTPLGSKDGYLLGLKVGDMLNVGDLLNDGFLVGKKDGNIDGLTSDSMAVKDNSCALIPVSHDIACRISVENSFAEYTSSSSD